MKNEHKFPLIEGLRGFVSEWSARVVLSTLLIGSVITISTFAGCGVASTTSNASAAHASR